MSKFYLLFNTFRFTIKKKADMKGNDKDGKSQETSEWKLENKSI